MRAGNKCFSVTRGEAGGLEKLLFGGRDFCRVKYHFKYWREPMGAPQEINLDSHRTSPGQLEVSGIVPGAGTARIAYIAGKDLRISFSFVSSAAQKIGFYFLGLEFPDDAAELRLLPGVYCGYTGHHGTFKFSSCYFEKAGLLQMASAIDQQGKGCGTTLTAYQYFTLSFPPAFRDGVVAVNPGQEITGEVIVTSCPENIWDPVHKVRELEENPRDAEMTARYPYSEFLANWENYIQDKDLWVELGDGMGMFHVGFYNLMHEPKLGGPYGYALNGRQVRHRELYELLFGKNADPQVKLDYFQDNTHQLEIAWGNGCNPMVAYALYHYGGDWFRQKADAIVKALLEFREGGFQIAVGPLAGAWINGYDADRGRFQDHYGGEQVFLPDQGIVNYFLGRIYLENFNRHPQIITKIRRNCRQFLLGMEKLHGTFPNAFSPDGTAGYSREGYLYDFPNAPGIAQTALSFVMLYRLAGEKEWLEQADRIISRYLQPLIAANKFGFLEYDHRGHCSAGACSILIALAEYLEAGRGKMLAEARRMQEKTFYHLLSFRHERDYFAYKHAHKPAGYAWGGVAQNRHQFLHGFTPGSSQAAYLLHTRYEYGYALLRTLETNPSLPARPALINHLRSFTWDQFVNPDLKKGFGGVAEYVGLRTNRDDTDTTHLIHSTPLPMILAERRPAMLKSQQNERINP